MFTGLFIDYDSPFLYLSNVRKSAAEFPQTNNARDISRQAAYIFTAYTAPSLCAPYVMLLLYYNTNNTESQQKGKEKEIRNQYIQYQMIEKTV